MKVLTIPSWYSTEESPNTGIFFKEQAIALQKSGLEVAVIYPEFTSLKEINKGFIRNKIEKKYEDKVLTYRYKGHFYLPKVRSGLRISTYKRIKRLYKLYVEENGEPDLIHAHSVRWAGWAAVKIGKRYNIPVVLTEHSSAYGRQLIPEKDDKYIFETLNQTSHLIAVGTKLKSELLKYVPEKEIEVIPNIVDVEKFNVIKKEEDKKFTFFSLAFLTKNKGMDLLIKAFYEAFNGDQSVELIIGGDGEEKEDLVFLVSRLGIQSQVHFLGELNREEVVSQMSKCDVFVLASHYETFGVVYIEALASGKPIIATRCGGPEDIVNEKNGLLVEKNNISELVQALLKMKKELKSYDPSKIRQECMELYSEESILTKLNDVYAEVLNERYICYEK